MYRSNFLVLIHELTHLDNPHHLLLLVTDTEEQGEHYIQTYHDNRQIYILLPILCKIHYEENHNLLKPFYYHLRLVVDPTQGFRAVGFERWQKAR